MNPAAKAEKALKELLKLPANKRCADCTGTGSLVRQRAGCPRLQLAAGCRLTRRAAPPAGAAVCVHELWHVRVHELRHRTVRAGRSWARCQARHAQP